MSQLSRMDEPGVCAHVTCMSVGLYVLLNGGTVLPLGSHDNKITTLPVCQAFPNHFILSLSLPLPDESER